MKINSLVFCALLFISVGCQKEDVDQKQVCKDIPPSSSPFGYEIVGTSRLMNRICFNPNNADEIAFLKPQEEGISALWTWNLKTNQQKKLVEHIWFQPDWSNQGWIAFTRPDAHIWKIKSNGDSLTQVTFKNENYYPNWSSDGKSLLLRRVTNNNAYVVRLDNSGKELFATDKIGGTAFQRISPDGTKISGVTMDYDVKYVIGYYTVPDFSFIPLKEFDVSHSGKGFILGAAWHPDSKTLFWSNQFGLFKSDIFTNNTILLKKGCNSRIFMHPAVSPDGNTLVVERLDISVEGNTKYQDMNIWMMDLNGNNERKFNP